MAMAREPPYDDAPYWEQRAAALCESPLHRQPEPPARAPAAPQKIVNISGGLIDIEFHGVAPNDAYLQPFFDVLKFKRGPKVKEEFSFFDELHHSSPGKQF